MVILILIQSLISFQEEVLSDFFLIFNIYDSEIINELEWNWVSQKTILIMSYIDLPIRRLEQTKILRRNSCYCDDCGNKYSKSVLELKEELSDWEYRKNLTNF